MPSVVDLFCGVGGLTHGFIKEGFKVLGGFDVDKSCRYAYEKNNSATFYEGSVSDLTGRTIEKLYPANDKKILVGCAPCQQFSLYNNKSSIDKSSLDDKWTLLNTFADLVGEVRPDVVSMENVSELQKFEIFKKFVLSLQGHGYHVTIKAVRCADYGIPQSRIRLVLLASRWGEINLIPPTHTSDAYVTVRDVIGDLPSLKAGGVDPNDTLHRASVLDDKNLQRIKASKPGGTWRDWPEDLRLDCHKKESGKSFASVYGRMKWDAVAPTMTTQFNGIGNGRFGHPEQDRAISLREGAIFQTFPRDYVFFPPNEDFSIEAVTRHIGNAVPVLLGQVIAKSINTHLESLHA